MQKLRFTHRQEWSLLDRTRERVCASVVTRRGTDPVRPLEHGRRRDNVFSFRDVRQHASEECALATRRALEGLQVDTACKNNIVIGARAFCFPFRVELTTAVRFRTDRIH